MQNASEVVVDKASSPPTCCFWWEITRGPHENVVLAVCLHEDAGANAVHEGLKVGRQKRCWLRLLKDLEVSSVHAEFRLASGKNDDADTTEQTDRGDKRLRVGRKQVVLCDLNSTNGTKLNGEPLVPHQEYALANQDLIHFGKTAVRFRVASSSRRAKEDVAASQLGDRDENSSVMSSADGEDGQDRQKVQGVQLAVDLTKDDVGEPSVCHKAGVESVDHVKPPALADRADQDDADSSEPTTAVDGNSDAGGGGFTTRDDDVFEAPRTSHVAQLSARAASSSPASSSVAVSASAMTCMICGQWLGHLDVLEQQLHINGCLDGRNHIAENWLLPLQHQHSASGRNQSQTKKRKRGRNAAATMTATTIEDDEVTLALAMSRSMANKEQEVDMEMALLSGELAQIDTQMAKLAKKREALLKKMAKLEKTKAKVRKSAVIPPAEARMLLDLSKVLQLLFPEIRRVATDDVTCSPAEFKRARLVASKYAPQVKTGVDSDRSWRLPSMWLRASQLLFGHTERDLYSNISLLPFARIEAEKKKGGTRNFESATQADNASTVSEVERRELEELSVPSSVKRVFPDWIENVAFLRQQSVEDLKEALQEMIQQRNDRLLRDEPEGEDNTLFASRSGNRADEDEACAFFENAIEELIQSKEGAASAGGAGEERPGASGSAENEVIIVDSDDDSDDCEELTEDTNASAAIQDEALVAARAHLPVSESQQDQATAPLSQATQIRDIDTAMQIQDTTPTALHPMHLIETSTATASCETQSSSSVGLDAGAPPAPERLTIESVNASSSELGHHSLSLQMATSDLAATGAGAAPNNTNGAKDVEVLLLQALKAHPMFYEMVLLLQPLDATDFVIYATQVAKIKCSKKAVLEFFDRHGITFKQN